MLIKSSPHNHETNRRTINSYMRDSLCVCAFARISNHNRHSRTTHAYTCRHLVCWALTVLYDDTTNFSDIAAKLSSPSYTRWTWICVGGFSLLITFSHHQPPTHHYIIDRNNDVDDASCLCFVVVVRLAMIHLQVHLQIPCYDFYPVQAIAIELFPAISRPEGLNTVVRSPLETAQSRTATGGVYKWQGRNQRELMTHTY